MYINVTIRDLKYLARSVTVHGVLVDPAADATWLARQVVERCGIGPIAGKHRTFAMADGRIVTRQVGFAMLQADPHLQTVDEIVFAEMDDVQRLGARTLMGFNVTLNDAQDRLVPAGPRLVPANHQTNPKD